MPCSDDENLDVEWYHVEKAVEEFVALLQQAATQWLYNGAQLDQVIAVDVKATVFLEEVWDVLSELGVLTDDLPMVVSIIT